MSVHLAVRPGQEPRAQSAIARCIRWLERVGERLTRFTAESELARLNVADGWQPVSKLLYNVVAESLAAAHASDGLFDPALLPLLEALGYDRDFRALAHEATAASSGTRPAFAAGRWREIELDLDGRRIRMPPGVRLDLGGIAKGWAADVALERFFDAFPHVLLDAGGDLRVRGGPEPDGCWALGIGDPRVAATEGDAAPAVVLTLGRGGLATSGATRTWWYQGGERRHHLLDPRTGLPARVWIDARDDAAGGAPLIATATALAPTAAHAEVATKVALLRGYPDALHAVERAWTRRQHSAAPETSGPAPVDRYSDATVALILILGTGEVASSAHIREYLAALGGGGELWLE